MERFKLQLEAKEDKKPNQLRRVGKVPGTLYGPGAESKSYQMCQKEFSRLPGAAYSQIIDLETPDGSIKALIRHVQRKAVSNEILNVEFYKINDAKKLTVVVPLKYVGTSPAVQKGGLLVEMFQSAEVECLPANIPDHLVVDISTIENIDGGIHFSQLQTPEGVKILNPPEELVARVVAKKGGGGKG